MTKQKLDSVGPVKEKKPKYEDLMELWKTQKPMPEIYTVPPKQPQEKKVGQLTSEQLKQFFEKVSARQSLIVLPKSSFTKNCIYFFQHLLLDFFWIDKD